MPIDAAKALAADPRPGDIGWDHKDIQLYHLGLGAGGRPPTRTSCATPSNPSSTSSPASRPSPAPGWP